MRLPQPPPPRALYHGQHQPRRGPIRKDALHIRRRTLVPVPALPLGPSSLGPRRLVLELLRPALLLSRHDALVLDLDLFPVARHLVALLGPGPEVAHGEAVVEVGPEVVHDANREHDIHAELGPSARSSGSSRQGGIGHLEDFQVEPAHFSLRVGMALGLVSRCTGQGGFTRRGGASWGTFTLACTGA